MKQARPMISGDALFRALTLTFAAGVVLLFVALLVVLWRESLPSIDAFGFGFLFSSEWNPVD